MKPITIAQRVVTKPALNRTDDPENDTKGREITRTNFALVSCGFVDRVPWFIFLLTFPISKICGCQLANLPLQCALPPSSVQPTRENFQRTFVSRRARFPIAPRRAHSLAVARKNRSTHLRSVGAHGPTCRPVVRARARRNVGE